MKKLLWLLPVIGAFILLNQSCSTESTPVYQLTTSTDPAEAGSVSQSAQEADEGETISITAEPNEHWVFNGWGGDHTGSDNPATVVMNRDKSVTAMFQKREYPLTINTVGEGQVHEKVIQPKTTDHPHGTIVELTAVPDDGWEFLGWTGDIDINEDVIEITIESETNITATFAEYIETAFPGQTGEITELTLGGVPIEVDRINNKYVYQGDILINPEDYAELDPSKAKTDLGIDVRTWENNTIPYYIDSDVPSGLRETINRGINMITENTSIIMREYNSLSDSFYLVFIESEGAWASGLGRNRIFTRHRIGLNENVPVGTVAHEIMHILGYAHEHSRTDRNEFVNIHFDNIQEDKQHNFVKLDWYNPSTPYDFFSVMHYPSFAFVKPTTSAPTITDLDGLTFTAQRNRLTSHDIAKINELYPQEIVFLHSNGVTIMCPAALPGDKGVVDGIEYEVVDRDLLIQRIDENADLTKVCVSLIDDMSELFRNRSFNQSINNWDVSNVTNMNWMFAESNFNQPIEKWDVSKVESMGFMFFKSSFNQSIGNWDVGSVIYIGGMFGEGEFNQPIGDWDVSNVERMDGMFSQSQFNQPIGSWDVSKVESMGFMFYESTFNQPIGNWDVSNVTEMLNMFTGTPFNQPIGEWDVSSVTNMREMFRHSQFNQSIGQWTVSNVKDMSVMFMNSPFNQQIGNWDVHSVNSMYRMFESSTEFNQDLSQWCVTNISTKPDNFDHNTPQWVLPKPVWGTCPD